MSGSNNFGNLALNAGPSGFASPVVKIGIAVGLAVLLFGGYMLLSGQASSLFHNNPGPPQQPPLQTSPVSAKFTAMPPAEVIDTRPRAQGPGGNTNTNTGGGGFGRNGNNVDDATLAAVSKIDLYSAQTRGASAQPPRNPDTSPDGRTAQQEKSALEASVTPTKFAATGVTELPHPDYLIEQGRSLRCTQMSLLNTTYAGSVTAILPDVIKGETGDVELIGAGGKIFGTIQHGIVNGADRAFVLWQQITTPIVRDRLGIPRQFRVAVDSPASDELGQTGLDGDLNRHLGQKIGAVIGLSLIQGVTQGIGSLMQRQGNNSNNSSPSINFNQMTTGLDTGANMLMQQFINLPDIMTRLQGKGCAIEMVRDVDLSAAYPKLRNLLDMGKAR